MTLAKRLMKRRHVRIQKELQMKKTVQRTSKFKAFWGMLALVLVLGAGLFAEDLAFVSHAESAAKVTASSAKIRKSADSSSEVIGSAAKDKTISIKSQTKGADGYTWYEVYVDANTLGYIRSDLVSITDGSTPASSSNTTTSTTTNTTTETQAPAANETPVDVTAVEPVSATVTGGQSVRVRSNASTTSQIVTTAENGMALTVTGQATGTDGNTWYQVNFISNNTEVTGFIRSDYVALSGELQSPSEEQPTEEQPTEEQPAEDTQTITKDWDTQLQGDAWYLLDMAGQKQYKIDDLFNSINQITEINAQFETNQKKISSQKVVIIILVILLVALAAAVTLLIFKIKDMNDAADFSDAEEEALRRRRVDRPQTGRGLGTRPAPQGGRTQGNQKVMHEVGAERRPAGKPAAQGQRSAAGQTARPVAPQGQRPAGQQARPVAPKEGRPAGQQTRPVAPQEGRPTGQQDRLVRPTAPGQRPVAPQGQRPSVPQTGRPAPQVDRPMKPAQNNGNSQDPGWKSKNFMSDDDEFEFEFLNWDGDEEQ